MRELNLYQTEEDELELIREALAAGCQIIPDSNYQSREVTAITSIEAFNLFRRAQRHFFISHESFAKVPLTLRPITKDGERLYYISPSQGGPLIEFMGGGLVVGEDMVAQQIRSGFLARRPDYWNEALTKKEAAPPELAEIYGWLVTVIRKTSMRIKPDQTVYWLGNHAKAELSRGVKLGLHPNWSLPSS